ncbi:MAG: hypothetical protein Metus_0370 [Candidatus Methanosuratincola subterraneus]|uniref:Uncharacterized protein n=1 Tax=Methanosuratincola subterraneus TaxID=2593994 RepID=A0A3S3SS56_METS7|nr:MAG: hypothetical protein Metus_0370 [Candidatus Methanosuratincola subterraneus]
MAAKPTREHYLSISKGYKSFPILLLMVLANFPNNFMSDRECGDQLM